MSTTKVVFGNGKYAIYHENGTNLRAYRYDHEAKGPTWRDLVGDGMVLAMAQRIEELELVLKEGGSVTEYWNKHYVNKGMCSLCGNSGVIDTTRVATNAGLEVGRLNFCICPNGQKIRSAHD